MHGEMFLVRGVLRRLKKISKLKTLDFSLHQSQVTCCPYKVELSRHRYLKAWIVLALHILR